MEQPTAIDTMPKLNGEVDETESFEIIQKADVEQTTVIDDANNNAPSSNVGAEPSTNADNNNNSNQSEINDKKYSREFLLQIKQQAFSKIKPEVQGAANNIITYNSEKLDSILTADLNKPRQNHQQTNEDMFKMMSNMGRAPYSTRVSEQGTKRAPPHLKGKVSPNLHVLYFRRCFSCLNFLNISFLNVFLLFLEDQWHILRSS